VSRNSKGGFVATLQGKRSGSAGSVKGKVFPKKACPYCEKLVSSNVYPQHIRGHECEARVKAAMEASK
jgi:hypothetical protein